jgi:hypothetical protein
MSGIKKIDAGCQQLKYGDTQRTRKYAKKRYYQPGKSINKTGYQCMALPQAVIYWPYINLPMKTEELHL